MHMHSVFTSLKISSTDIHCGAHSCRGSIDRQPAPNNFTARPHGTAARESFIRRDVASTRIRSAARSAMAITGALVFPRTTVGMTDASTTLRPSTPNTRSCESTTRPIPHVTEGSQVGRGRTASRSVVLRDLESPRSQLARAVEVIVTRVAGMNERFDDVARFDQCNLGGGVLTQSCRQNASCGTATHDYVVIAALLVICFVEP
jgi:hypothetical protein